ncbi:MAG TPA: sigma-70 family RNA polymerase sigma factor [Planctomycetota bacterium]|nr:sigma-70 family RNA polymerase sigma factor [Planctomycetota bacterium]
MKTDSELLQEYVGGSDDAFDELVRRYMDPVYRVCFRILREPASAEDAAQATFIVLMRRARKLPRRVVLSGWLLKTAAFVARDAVKLRYRRVKYERSMTPPPATATQAETELLQQELSQYLDAALEALPSVQRDCIVLRFLCGRTEESVADELGCPRSTVSTRIATGLTKLRERLSLSGVTVPAVALVAYLGIEARSKAPDILAAFVSSIAKGRTVPSDGVLLLSRGTLARYEAQGRLPWKIASAAAAIMLLGLCGSILWRSPAAGPPTKAPQKIASRVPSHSEPAPVVEESIVDEPLVSALPVKAPSEAAAAAAQVAAPEPNLREPERIDLTRLAANTWVELRPKLLMEVARPGEQGRWSRTINKLVYDAASKRVLFYDRWATDSNGGALHYANCLFSFDPASNEVRALKLDHWTVENNRVKPMAENGREPTPCSRQLFHGFAWVPSMTSVYLCNGANASAEMDGKLRGHDVCENTWRFDLAAHSWQQVTSKQHPKNFPLGASLEYCAVNESLVYCNSGSLWLMTLADGQWRELGSKVPTGGAGQTLAYDPVRKRMMIVGGSRVDMSAPLTRKNEDDPGFRRLYAFDPVTEAVRELADSPTPLYMAHLAYDSKRDRFVTANFMTTGRAPSGVFSYDPRTDTWSEVHATNTLPKTNWFGWVRMCYDSERDCFIALIPGHGNEMRFYAFRCVP